MKRVTARALAIVGMLAPAASMAATDDPYAALKLFDGKWIAVSSAGGATPIENHCARTGKFFACEQMVNGKTAALVVFLPDGPTEKGEAYLVQTLVPTGQKPGLWRTLTIEGDRWTYSDPAPRGGKARRERSVDQFLGPDHIHYELQSSVGGKAWITVRSGDQRRAP